MSLIRSRRPAQAAVKYLWLLVLLAMMDITVDAGAQNCIPGMPCNDGKPETQKNSVSGAPNIYGSDRQAQKDKAPAPHQPQAKVTPPPLPLKPPPPQQNRPAVGTKPAQARPTGEPVPVKQLLIPEETQKEQEIAIDLPAGDMSTVLPEVSTRIPLSNSDVNRVVCPLADIKDVVYSKEKSVTVRIAGKNAFVKFHVLKKESRDVYARVPTEFFIICGDKTFNIIGIPKRIASQTVTLSGGKQENIKKNAALFGELPFERRVISLIKKVYTDDISESLTVMPVNRPMPIFRQIELTLKRVVMVEGEGLRVKEFTASMRNSSELDTVQLKEKDFLRNEITAKPQAISIDIMNLRKGETARIFIVELGEGT